MLSALDLGFTQLRNRVIMGSIHSGLEGGLLLPSALQVRILPYLISQEAIFLRECNFWFENQMEIQRPATASLGDSE